MLYTSDGDHFGTPIDTTIVCDAIKVTASAALNIRNEIRRTTIPFEISLNLSNSINRAETEKTAAIDRIDIYDL